MAILRRNVFAIILLMAANAHAYAENTLQLAEQEIKAGLLYNFLKYTDWPHPETGPVMLCLFGEDSFSGYLQPMAGRTVNQREIVIRNIKTISEVKDCHLVFINAAEKTRWSQLQQALTGKNVLTVSDFKGFTSTGGMIEFTRRNEHVSVDLNMSAVTAAGLKVGDRLLRLVTVVDKD